MKAQTAKTLDVVGVGSWTNFDHLFVVDRLPLPGDTVQVTSGIEAVEQVFFGGCAPNNVAAAARLGAQAGLIGIVGRDFATRGYQTYFEQLGVDLSGLTTIQDGLCGHSFLYSDPEGKAICLSHLGVAARQEDYEPNLSMLAQAKVVVINYRFDSYTLQAARHAKETAGLVIVSGALITAPEYSSAFVSTTDILVCTEHELGQLIEFLKLDDRTQLFGHGLQAIITTKGKQGSQLVTLDRTINIPIAQAARIVDPVGAGDGFMGGVATGLAFGYTLEDAARLGAVVASFVVEALGCQTNLPTFEQAATRYLKNFHQPLDRPRINSELPHLY